MICLYPLLDPLVCGLDPNVYSDEFSADIYESPIEMEFEDSSNVGHGRT